MSASREAARFPAKNSQPNQSCSGAALVAAIIPRPEVMDSSTTIAFSGKNLEYRCLTPFRPSTTSSIVALAAETN